jgi:hypothetical protein
VVSIVADRSGLSSRGRSGSCQDAHSVTPTQRIAVVVERPDNQRAVVGASAHGLSLAHLFAWRRA